MSDMPKRLYRSRTDRIIAGVAGGLGQYFDVDPVIFRVLFVVFTFAGGSGVIIYIVLAIVIPTEPGSAPEPAAEVVGRERVHEFAQEVKDGAHKLADEMRGGQSRQGRRNFFGFLIVIVGLIFLAQNFGFLNADIGTIFAKFWPVLVILLGLSFLSGRGLLRNLIMLLLIVVIFAALIVAIFYPSKISELSGGCFTAGQNGGIQSVPCGPIYNTNNSNQ